MYSKFLPKGRQFHKSFVTIGVSSLSLLRLTVGLIRLASVGLLHRYAQHITYMITCQTVRSKQLKPPSLLQECNHCYTGIARLKAPWPKLVGHRGLGRALYVAQQGEALE